MGLLFEWDEQEAAGNLRKHGISFAEAQSVFGDTLSVTVEDPLHSEEEERHVTIGRSVQQRLVVVVHTDRGDRIRIISARLASQRERRDYEESS